MSKKLTIKVTNEEIFLTNDLSIGITHTNFPATSISFKNEFLFWKTEMVKFKKGVLFLKVLDFDAGKEEFSVSQLKPGYSIAKLEFDKFEKESLEPLLNSYLVKDLNKLCGIEEDVQPLENTDSELDRAGLQMFPQEKREAPTSNELQESFLDYYKTRSNPEDNQEPELSSESIPEPVLEPVLEPEIIKEKFFISFEEFEIINNGVRFKKSFLPNIKKEIEFFIENPYLLQEFNTIKGWFKKKLKIEGITVTAEIEVFGDKITILKADSTELGQINNELIGFIQIERVTNLTSKISQSDPDSYIFSIDDIFQEGEKEDFGGNLFDQSEEDILDILLKKDKIRNEKHIRYLANQVQSIQFKIQFTVKPHFGFLFTSLGKNKSFYILELLNSNATYIWRFIKSKEGENHFPLVNIELKKLNEVKRRNYRSQADESIFKAVSHTGIGKEVEGDVDTTSWVNRLNDALK